MEYKIVEGRVQTRALEYHIIDHCNLRCNQCCSYSPFLKSWLCKPDQFETDLLRVKNCVQPTFLKIVGGEPLLHPDLPQLLEIAHKVGIAPKISVTTNGHLLDRLPEDSWKSFQMLTVSVYPDPQLGNEKIRWINAKAKENNITVSWKIQDKFVNLNRETVATYEEAKETYQGCWIHHRCNSIKGGRFYSCTRPQYLQKLAVNSEVFLEDGVELAAYDDETLPLVVLKHLQSSEPIRACFVCKGGQSSLDTQRQLSPSEVKTEKNRLIELCKTI